MDNFSNMKKKAQETTDKVKEVGLSTSGKIKEAGTVTFDKIKGIGTATTDKISEIRTLTNDKIDAGLAEYQEAIATLQSFGLKANKLHVNVTIPPEISVAIYGSMSALDKTSLQEMLDANREKKLLSTILTALLTAASLRKAMRLENLNNLTINVRLGLPPSVAVDVE